MRVMVTGNLGYSGVAIVNVLLQHGYQVVGFDRAGADDRNDFPNFQQIKGDITRIETILPAVDGCTAIVHTAIGTRVLEDDIREYELSGTGVDYCNILPFKINVEGTFNVFEAARQAGISQVINLSSAAVVFYHLIDHQDGHVREFKLTADSPVNFRGYYGMNKHLQEEIGAYYAREYNLSVITLRPWWIVDGPRNMNRYGVDLSLDVHPLTPAGLICRYDLGELIHLALQRPDIHYDILYPVTGPNSERYFDVDHLQKTLDWTPNFTFQELATSWKGLR